MSGADHNDCASWCCQKPDHEGPCKGLEWIPYDLYPADPAERPGRQFIRMVGYQEHSGHLWTREITGVVCTHNDGPFGYVREDFDRLMQLGGMDVCERISHYMPYRLPTIT